MESVGASGEREMRIGFGVSAVAQGREAGRMQAQAGSVGLWARRAEWNSGMLCCIVYRRGCSCGPGGSRADWLE